MPPTTSPWTFRRLATAYAAGAAAFLALDAAWLTLAGSRLYRPAIGHLMRDGFDGVAAAAFYAIYLGGLVAFVVAAAATTRQAMRRGGFFGAVCYATYDLTNQATLAGWPWHVTLADIAWGAFATAAAGAVALRAARGRPR